MRSVARSLFFWQKRLRGWWARFVGVQTSRKCIFSPLLRVDVTDAFSISTRSTGSRVRPVPIILLPYKALKRLRFFLALPV